MTTRLELNAFEKNEVLIMERNYNHWAADPDETIFYHFKKSYFGLLEYIEIHDVPDLSKKVVEFTAKFCLGSHDMNEELSMTHSNSIVRLLLDKENLSHFLQYENAELAIQWFLLDHSVVYHFQENESHVQKCRDLVEKYTGRAVDSTVIPDIANMTAFLYGPAVWELYGFEIPENMSEGDISRCVFSILNINPPLLHKQNNTVTIPGIHIPETLI